MARRGTGRPHGGRPGGGRPGGSTVGPGGLGRRAFLGLAGAAGAAGAAGVAAPLLAACSQAASGPAGPAGGGVRIGEYAPGPQPASGGRRGGTVNVVWSDPPDSFDPAVGSNLTAWDCITELVFFGALMAYDRQFGGPVPNLAAAPPRVSPDGTTLTFRIKPDVRFHNGRAIVAGDFAYSWQRLLDPKLASWGASYLSSVVGADAVMAGKAAHLDGVEAPDDATLAVHLTAPDFTILNALALPITAPVPREEVERLGNVRFGQTPVGYGPFRIVSYDGAGQTARFERDPRYFYPGLPYLSAVEYHWGADPQIQLLQLEHGVADIIGSGIPSSIARQHLADHVPVDRAGVRRPRGQAGAELGGGPCRPRPGDLRDRDSVGGAVPRPPGRLHERVPALRLRSGPGQAAARAGRLPPRAVVHPDRLLRRPLPGDRPGHPGAVRRGRRRRHPQPGLQQRAVQPGIRPAGRRPAAGHVRRRLVHGPADPRRRGRRDLRDRRVEQLLRLFQPRGGQPRRAGQADVRPHRPEPDLRPDPAADRGGRAIRVPGLDRLAGRGLPPRRQLPLPGRDVQLLRPDVGVAGGGDRAGPPARPGGEAGPGGGGRRGRPPGRPAALAAAGRDGGAGRVRGARRGGAAGRQPAAPGPDARAHPDRAAGRAERALPARDRPARPGRAGQARLRRAGLADRRDRVQHRLDRDRRGGRAGGRVLPGAGRAGADAAHRCRARAAIHAGRPGHRGDHARGADPRDRDHHSALLVLPRQAGLR